jgi:DnaJ homolog subfamily C member 19
MGLVLALAAGLLGYLYFTRQLTPRVWRWVAAAALAFLAARGFKSTPLVAALMAAGSATLLLWERLPRKAGRGKLSLDEARDILGVGPDASADEIRAAHRRIIAQVHPDKGGTAELTRRVNAARDALLDALNRQPPRAS